MIFKKIIFFFVLILYADQTEIATKGSSVTLYDQGTLSTNVQALLKLHEYNQKLGIAYTDDFNQVHLIRRLDDDLRSKLTKSLGLDQSKTDEAQFIKVAVDHDFASKFNQFDDQGKFVSMTDFISEALKDDAKSQEMRDNFNKHSLESSNPEHREKLISSTIIDSLSSNELNKYIQTGMSSNSLYSGRSILGTSMDGNTLPLYDISVLNISMDMNQLPAFQQITALLGEVYNQENLTKIFDEKLAGKLSNDIIRKDLMLEFIKYTQNSEARLGDDTPDSGSDVSTAQDPTDRLVTQSVLGGAYSRVAQPESSKIDIAGAVLADAIKKAVQGFKSSGAGDTSAQTADGAPALDTDVTGKGVAGAGNDPARAVETPDSGTDVASADASTTSPTQVAFSQDSPDDKQTLTVADGSVETFPADNSGVNQQDGSDAAQTSPGSVDVAPTETSPAKQTGADGAPARAIETPDSGTDVASADASTTSSAQVVFSQDGSDDKQTLTGAGGSVETFPADNSGVNQQDGSAVNSTINQQADSAGDAETPDSGSDVASADALATSSTQVASSQDAAQKSDASLDFSFSDTDSDADKGRYDVAKATIENIMQHGLDSFDDRENIAFSDAGSDAGSADDTPKSNKGNTSFAIHYNLHNQGYSDDEKAVLTADEQTASTGASGDGSGIAPETGPGAQLTDQIANHSIEEIYDHQDWTNNPTNVLAESAAHVLKPPYIIYFLQDDSPVDTV